MTKTKTIPLDARLRAWSLAREEGVADPRIRLATEEERAAARRAGLAEVRDLERNTYEVVAEGATGGKVLIQLDAARDANGVNNREAAQEVTLGFIPIVGPAHQVSFALMGLADLCWGVPPGPAPEGPHPATRAYLKQLALGAMGVVLHALAPATLGASYVLDGAIRAGVILKDRADHRRELQGSQIVDLSEV